LPGRILLRLVGQGGLEPPTIPAMGGTTLTKRATRASCVIRWWAHQDSNPTIGRVMSLTLCSRNGLRIGPLRSRARFDAGWSAGLQGRLGPHGPPPSA
jgi:hypothetical protein